MRVSDINHLNHTIRVVGKGEVDDVAPFGAESATALKEWVRKYRWWALPDDYLITAKNGKPLHPDSVAHLLHDVSRRAGLSRLVSAHALRHYFGTRVLIQTGDLELTRQLLRHRTLMMALNCAA